MRVGVLFCSLVLVGCAQPEAVAPRVIVKTVTKVVVEKDPAAKIKDRNSHKSGMPA